MAKGYPDYYGIPMFPSYIGCTEAEGDVVVTASEYTTILTVTGKGLLYLGEIYLVANSPTIGDSLRIEIDGSEINEMSWVDLVDKSSFFATFCRWTLSTWNVPAQRYNAIWTGPVPFGTSVSLLYRESAGLTPSVNVVLRYSKILA